MADAVVIIPHYNDVARLERCLRALAPQIPASGAVDVLVVDNGSSDPLTAVQQQFPMVRFVSESTKGAAAARNRGVQDSTAERVFFLDCDCVPDADWLATAQRISGTADVIGGRISLFDETPAPRSGAEAFETVFAFENKRYIEEKGFSVTANLLTTRTVFEATGPLIVGLSEDLDWCHRAVAAGHTIAYSPDLHVAHPTRSDWAALRKKWHRLNSEGFGVNGHTLRARCVWAAKALAMPLSVIAHVPKVLRHPDLASGTERLRAVATLARLRLLRGVWMLKQAVSPA